MDPKSARVTRADLRKLASLLPAIFAVFADEGFTSKEVREHPSLRGFVGELSVRSLGCLFRRAEHRTIDGFRLERLGTEANTVLWRVVKV